MESGITDHVTAGIGISVEEIAEKLGIPVDSMKMRIRNCQHLETDGALVHVTNQARSVFNRLGGCSELQLRIKAKECLVSSTHS
jgi:hypothetical protein